MCPFCDALQQLHAREQEQTCVPVGMTKGDLERQRSFEFEDRVKTVGSEAQAGLWDPCWPFGIYGIKTVFSQQQVRF